MNGEKLGVIFDTNSYRKLTLELSQSELKTLIKKLKKAEAKKNIKAYCISIVSMELLANLAENKTGPNYQNCLKSLVLLSNHCYGSEKKTVRLIPPPFVHVTKMLFDYLPEDYEKMSNKISKLLDSFRIYSGKPPTELLPESFFDFLKNRLQRDEEKFSKDIEQLIHFVKISVEFHNKKSSEKLKRKKMLDLIKSDGFEQVLSEGIIKNVSEEINKPIDKEEKYKRGYWMKTQIPFSVKFFKWICNEIVSKNIDMKSNKSKAKRWNWLWDYQVSFLITKSTIDNRKMMLVTSDQDISKMLKENNFENEVMTIEQYKEYIGI